MNIPIVVVTYNRPESLKRLLKSIANAEYPTNLKIELIISIDFSEDNSCIKVSKEFNWIHGHKTLIKHNAKMGLKNHIISCGDISQNYDGIILLEDDLIVSPSFYYYSIAASQFYTNKQHFCGISLYSYERNEFCDIPFSPTQDSFDTFLMKVPSSCGQIFLNSHWSTFKIEYNKIIKIEETDFIPEQIYSWPETSWKKLYFKHMIKNDLYFVYPMHSYSSNMGTIGTHFFTDASFIKTNLTIKKENFKFPDLNNTINIYDQFMEWEPEKIKMNERFRNIWKDIEIDLFGFKPLNKIRKSKIITSRKVSKSYGQFSSNMHPLQLNLITNNTTIHFESLIFNITDHNNIFNDNSQIKEYFNSCICPTLNSISFYKGMNLVKQSNKYKMANLIFFPGIKTYHIYLLLKSYFVKYHIYIKNRFLVKNTNDKA